MALPLMLQRKLELQLEHVVTVLRAHAGVEGCHQAAECSSKHSESSLFTRDESLVWSVRSGKRHRCYYHRVLHGRLGHKSCHE